MKPLSINAALAASLFAMSLAMSNPAAAIDLNGAWASNADSCGKVFERKGSQVTFTEMSDVYGGGFIIEGDQITGKFARCRIKARKDDGKSINLVASCATDIMLQSVQFSLRELDANNVIRMFPGMEDMEIRYARCPAP
jgi:hypothetical protein